MNFQLFVENSKWSNAEVHHHPQIEMDFLFHLCKQNNNTIRKTVNVFIHKTRVHKEEHILKVNKILKTIYRLLVKFTTQGISGGL